MKSLNRQFREIKFPANTIFFRDCEIKDSRNVPRKFSRNLSPAKIKENKVLKTLSRKPIHYVTIHFQDRSSAASLQHKSRSKIGVLCVNESPIRYVFGAGTSVDIALVSHAVVLCLTIMQNS